MNIDDIIAILTGAGYETGWVVNETGLVIWEHDEDPPSPLIRPSIQSEIINDAD